MSGQQTEDGRRIVAGVDGSASSLEALRWAIRQADLTGGSVDAVIAWESPAASGLGWGLAVTDDTDYAELAAKTVTEAIGAAADPAGRVRVCPARLGQPALHASCALSRRRHPRREVTGPWTLVSPACRHHYLI
jgi:nucleotide-binding universal stress UspA family protein